MSGFKRLLPVLLLGLILGLVIWQTPPPASLTSASVLQLTLFLTPLFLLLTFLVDHFLRFFLRSLVVSLGLVILLVLKALDSLNIASLIMTVLAVVLIIKSLKKPKKLNYSAKIPKLTSLKKQR